MWTITLALVLSSIVFVPYLRTAIRKFTKKSQMIYPSNAVVDQIMPPEIMEQIFNSCDYGSIIACCSVSKYWHQFASNSQLHETIFRNDTTLLLNKNELLEMARKHSPRFSFNDPMFYWLEYPYNYPWKFRASDLLFAKQRNKMLIETYLHSARNLCITLASIDAPDNEDLKSCLVKLRCRLQYKLHNDIWRLEVMRSNRSILLDMKKFLEGYKYEYTQNMKCDVILDLNTMTNSETQDCSSGLRRIRMFDDRPYIAGFPVGSVLIQILILLVIPCLYADTINSTAPNAKYGFKIALIVLWLITFLILPFLHHLDSDQSTLRNQLATIPKKFILFLERRDFGLIGLVLSGVLHPWIKDLVIYTVLLIAFNFYYEVWIDVYRLKYRFSKLVAYIAAILVILTNDWKLTVDALLSGEMLSTALENILMHLVFGLFLLSYLRYRRGYYNSWIRVFRYLYFRSSFGLIFITIYAPMSINKIFVFGPK